MYASLHMVIHGIYSSKWFYVVTKSSVGEYDPDNHARSLLLDTPVTFPYIYSSRTSQRKWYLISQFYTFLYSLPFPCFSPMPCLCVHTHSLLYHKMNQPMDSLQSYLCAVYLDLFNMSCWINLGCLYESVAQPV